MSYIAWEFYSSLFTEVDEENFNRYEKRAEMKIDTLTHRRVKEFMLRYDKETATDFHNNVYDSIQTTMYELVNALYQHDTIGLRKGIKSVSNDGYSETYDDMSATSQDNEIENIVQNGLSGTGLCGAL